MAGNAAVLVDPRNVEEIKAAMVKILQPEVRAALLPLMEQRVANFEWDKCAAEHQQVFESLIK